ncbi:MULTISPECIES: lactate dehydrogenase [Lacticaseibacillus]|uniref:Lactate dehydrogenase n=2 Tax=Lacticaseibacillus TaxID=2759736 RepID=A0AAN1EYP1_LACCA|nr:MULTISPECIES: lactate dehydrogenase [Lacticaseibacillus]ARY91408.1 lactate dehydrogenase [Lacticaseibacillus casei]KAB1968515.1 lactate dehydrogenase [Lacticaseibacillus casei]WLV82024.1 lactate dehydrogenase [Lacticaseibacillus sp. NCIMB 15473]WNX25930.1 lactate dehydrogenase [Lacticaseibacillus casei]WNX28703.1 lactate dehydrogenase [Lacticaseibacillus casei]
MQRVVVHGASCSTQALLQTLIASPLDLEIGCYEPDAALVDVAGLTALSQICHNTFIKVTPKVLKTADVLILTDTETPDDENFVATNIASIRKVLNSAMAAGFTGRVVVAMTHDERFTYFAQRFSGLNKRQVVGLGTFGATWRFEQFLADRLAVPATQVTAYVVGTSQSPVLIWSRAYVGATPILRLLNDDQAVFTEAASAVHAFLASALTVLVGRLVEPILAAFAGEKLIGTFAHLRDSDDETGQVDSSPILLDERGVVTLATVAGSDDEEAALSTAIQAVQAEIEAIEQGADKNET